MNPPLPTGPGCLGRVRGRLTGRYRVCLVHVLLVCHAGTLAVDGQLEVWVREAGRSAGLQSPDELACEALTGRIAHRFGATQDGLATATTTRAFGCLTTRGRLNNQLGTRRRERRLESVARPTKRPWPGSSVQMRRSTQRALHRYHAQIEDMLRSEKEHELADA